MGRPVPNPGAAAPGLYWGDPVAVYGVIALLILNSGSINSYSWTRTGKHLHPEDWRGGLPSFGCTGWSERMTRGAATKQLWCGWVSCRWKNTGRGRSPPVDELSASSPCTCLTTCTTSNERWLRFHSALSEHMICWCRFDVGSVIRR